MNISEQEPVRQDTLRQKPDTTFQKQDLRADSTGIRDSLPPKKKEYRMTVAEAPVTDTVSVSQRSRISDITFYDPANIITRIDRDQINGFPYLFIRKNREQEAESAERLMKELKDGTEIPSRPFHDDWLIFIVLISGFFYASISTFSKKLFPGVIRFFLFRGVGGPESRETGELFHWESTIMNLISFFNIALFAYCVAYFNNLVPATFNGIAAWFIALGIIIVVITLRHISCIVTGIFSSRKEIFDEYIITIYQSYRYAALIFLILVVMLYYTDIFSQKTLIYSGYASFAVLYVMRIIRLFLIFLKRNASVLYLILYLCALEFLPVAVLVKFITGLV